MKGKDNAVHINAEKDKSMSLIGRKGKHLNKNERFHQYRFFKCEEALFSVQEEPLFGYV